MSKAKAKERIWKMSEVSQIEKSLREMYDLGYKHGYEKALRVVELEKL